MEALNLMGLERSERDFRKAAKLLTSLLEPASGKVPSYHTIGRLFIEYTLAR